MGIFGESKRLEIVGLLVSAVDLLLHLIGFSTTYWCKFKVDALGNSHFGLWNLCGIIAGTLSDCFKIDETTIPKTFGGSFKGTQVLECLALVGFVIAVVSPVLKVFVLNDKKIMDIITLQVYCFIPGLFGLVGVNVFGTMETNGNKITDICNFHFSFVTMFIITWHKNRST